MPARLPVATLKRPLPIASAASVALHLVIMLALGLLFARAHLSAVDTLPVLSLSLATAEPGKTESEQGEPDPPTAEPESNDAVAAPVAAAQPVELPPQQETPTITRAPEETVDQRVAESLSSQQNQVLRPAADTPAMTAMFEPPEPADQPAPSTELPTDPPGPSAVAERVVPGVSSADFVATTGAAPRTIATAAPGLQRTDNESQPLTARQQKMLDRRIEQWAQKIDKLAADTGIEWKHRGQLYKATFEPRPATDNTGFDEVVVTISTEQDGQRMSTELVMRRLAFSQFGQFVHRWDPAVKIHDDYIDGRFHSNSEVQLSYSRKVVPQFAGRVTIAGRRVRIHDASGYVSRDEMFRGGLETGVRTIHLPGRFVPFPDKVPAEPAQVHEFDADTRLQFHADGSYSYAPLNAIEGHRRRALAQPTQYLIAKGNKRLHIAGTVDGRVLVYSPGNIVIEGDLRYANDARTDKASDDFLGIVSDRSVEIAAQRITGPGDLRIDAAIYAKRSFRVRDFRSGGDTSLLHLYGSLTAGSLDATEPRYRTRIEFDDRLEHVRPPSFPVTGRYEVVSRDLGWRPD